MRVLSRRRLKLFLILLVCGKASAVNFQLSLLFSVGDQSVQVTGLFYPLSSGTRIGYALMPGTLRAIPTDKFPKAAIDILIKSDYKVTLSSTDTTKTLEIFIDTHSSDTDAFVPPRMLSLSQANSTFQFKKNEGTIKTSNGDTGNCKIEPSGEQPKPGVYAVILTKPAPCDFKLPTVRVFDIDESFVDFPIGTYWRSRSGPETLGDTAHNFPVVTVPRTVYLDNGFFLVQPNHETYLLVDAGRARKSSPAYKSTQTIAEEVSQSLGFGYTRLLQPKPDSTVFQKGSVVALYDDTPDMGGWIDVKALVNNTPTDLKLRWEAYPLIY